ncbi:hypothetical protein ACFLRA_01090 [Bdellovibrionota bacterium]
MELRFSVCLFLTLLFSILVALPAEGRLQNATLDRVLFNPVVLVKGDFKKTIMPNETFEESLIGFQAYQPNGGKLLIELWEEGKKAKTFALLADPTGKKKYHFTKERGIRQLVPVEEYKVLRDAQKFSGIEPSVVPVTFRGALIDIQADPGVFYDDRTDPGITAGCQNEPWEEPEEERPLYPEPRPLSGEDPTNGNGGQKGPYDPLAGTYDTKQRYAEDSTAARKGDVGSRDFYVFVQPFPTDNDADAAWGTKAYNDVQQGTQVLVDGRVVGWISPNPGSRRRMNADVDDNDPSRQYY